MIDIKELRIGNIVNYMQAVSDGVDYKRGVITSLTQNKAIVNGIGIKYCNLLPVLLDEKILQGTGFERNIWGDFSYKNGWLSLDINGRNGDDRITSYITEKDDDNISLTEIECTSLHELQNCFFAITRKELEINL